MKRIIAVLLILVMAVSLCACGSKKDNKGDSQSQPVGANMANPMHETTADEIAKYVGEILIPVGSEDVSYYTIDGDPVIYQVKFTLGGCEYCYRISANDELTDTSGMYYEWKNTDVASVDGRDATVCWNDGTQGIIYWYDVVPGLNYSLSMTSNAGHGALTDMANNIFVCVQGDS